MARLPIPGSDDGTWGDILNAYLLQSLTADGSIRTGAVGSPQLADGAVSTPKLADNAITSAKLAPSAVTSSHLSTGSVTNSAITDGAIAQSKIANLSGDLAGKASTTHTHSIADTTNLQTTLDSKADSVHTHTVSQLSDATTAGRTLITAADATAQRTALGLGSAATLTVGTTAGTVAAGDDSRLTGAVQTSGLDAATAALVGNGGSATMSSLTSTFATLAHASRHASGGADAVTPAAIGATGVGGFRTYVPGGVVPSAYSGASRAWVTAATFYGGYMSVGNSSGNYVEYEFYAPAGTYTLTIAYALGSFCGIVATAIDGAAALATTIDMYAASPAYHQSTAITSVAIATSGMHTVRFSSSSKNGSSSGYYVNISGFSLKRTGA